MGRIQPGHHTLTKICASAEGSIPCWLMHIIGSVCTDQSADVDDHSVDVEEDVDVNAPSDTSNALTAAAQTGNLVTVKRLIKASSKPERP